MKPGDLVTLNEHIDNPVTVTQEIGPCNNGLNPRVGRLFPADLALVVCVVVGANDCSSEALIVFHGTFGWIFKNILVKV